MRPCRFQRAFAAGTVHDFFNILAVIILFPLEMATHFLEKIATLLSNAFVGIGGIKFLSPIKAITTPVIDVIKELIHIPVILIILALALLFISLIQLVKIMRSLMLTQIEVFLDKYLFKNAFAAITLGIILTILVQSSSVTTSIVVPLVAAGIVSLGHGHPQAPAERLLVVWRRRLLRQHVVRRRRRNDRVLQGHHEALGGLQGARRRGDSSPLLGFLNAT